MTVSGLGCVVGRGDAAAKAHNSAIDQLRNMLDSAGRIGSRSEQKKSGEGN
jgi:hypothetical protein